MQRISTSNSYIAPAGRTIRQRFQRTNAICADCILQLQMQPVKLSNEHEGYMWARNPRESQQYSIFYTATSIQRQVCDFKVEYQLMQNNLKLNEKT